MKKKLSFILLIAIITAFTACGSSMEATYKAQPTDEPKATPTLAVKEDTKTSLDDVKSNPEVIFNGEAGEPAPDAELGASDEATPTPTPEAAILPVTTKAPDEVAQILPEEREEVYYFVGETSDSFISVTLDKVTNDCVLTLGDDEILKGTYIESDSELVLEVGGTQLYFEKVDNSLIINKKKIAATKISDRFGEGSLFKKVTGSEKIKENIGDAVIAGDPIETKSHVVRTNGYVDGEKYPKTVVITSRAELDKYYEDYKDVYELGSAFSSAVTFWLACSGYDDAFFAEKNLVLIVLESGTGMINYTVTDAFYGNGFLSVNIDAATPEVHTTDMAEWHLILETSKIVKPEDKVAVNITNKQADGFSPTEKIPTGTK